MLLIFENLLDEPDLATTRHELALARWRSGAETAGATAKAVKHNEQADHADPSVGALSQFVTRALRRHDGFALAARPRRISPILFSRYRTGDYYGRHTDNAIMGSGMGTGMGTGVRAGAGEDDALMRSDLAFTLFLSPPEAYDGGELVIETPADEQAIKLPAGALVLYPATSLHRVDPITGGERLAAVGWVQSLIASAEQRELLWDLEMQREATRAGGLDAHRLDRAIANLLRMWARP